LQPLKKTGIDWIVILGIWILRGCLSGRKKRIEKKQKIFGENKKVITFALPFSEKGD
jgi:hypothetical protein